MSNEYDSNPLLTLKLRGDSVEIKFPVQKELETITLSYRHIDLAIEYYLLARYAYLHKINSAFMLNTWHMAVLVLNIRWKTETTTQRTLKMLSSSRGQVLHLIFCSCFAPVQNARPDPVLSIRNSSLRVCLRFPAYSESAKLICFMGKLSAWSPFI